MRKAAFAIALLLGGAAFAQTGSAPEAEVSTTASTAYEGDGMATAAWETEGSGAMAAAIPAASGGQIVQPGNSQPERDARGIAVISAPAVVPAGWNGTAATGVGGPLLDPATGEAAPAADYPACTATVTDKCLQTYEKGRSAG